MDCPHCHAPNTYISYTHPGDGERVERNRRCADCRHSFETIEQMASELPRSVVELRAELFEVMTRDTRGKLRGNGKRCLTTRK